MPQQGVTPIGYQEYRRNPIHADRTMIYLEKHQTRT